MTSTIALWFEDNRLVVTLLFWLAFVLAHRSGSSQQNRIAKQFKELLLANQHHAVWVGGARWIVHEGSLQRTSRLGEYSWHSRIARQSSNELVLPVMGFVLPLLGGVFFDASKQGDVAGSILFALSLFILCWESLFQWGFQWIWGAKVLDPSPEAAQLERLNKRKAFGDADENSEAQAVAGLSQGAVKPSRVYSQEF